MGNYSSCLYVRQQTNPKTAKLMDSNGNLRQVKTPIRAAELMLEEPGFVVSAVHELLRAGRVVACKAEDELLAGKLYVLVSLSRINRRISESELGFVKSAVAAEKMLRKNKRGCKVSPALPPVEVKEEEMVTDVEVLQEQDAGFSCCRLGKYRQWSPVLEPIIE